MNMKLSEWNESITYANAVCENLKAKGYNIKLIPYTTYDQRKGLNFQVLDETDNMFISISTGIHNTVPEMKKAINQVVKKIMSI